MTKSRPVQEVTPAIDEHCEIYQDLFDSVRSYENIKFIHFGMLAQTTRKSLPNMAKICGLANGQRLHHCIAGASWKAEDFRTGRLAKVRKLIGDTPIVLLVDETGHRKKGTSTDYVSRQYLGELGKIDNGLVSVHLIALVHDILIPLTFQVFKPKSRLLEGDKHVSKPLIATAMLQEIVDLEFSIKLVLADCAYGETSAFRRCCESNNLKYILALREDHGFRVGPKDKMRWNRWRKTTRHFVDGSEEDRYIREFVINRSREIKFFEMTSDKETCPQDQTNFVTTNLEKGCWKDLPDQYGDRTWVEYSFRVMKTELGWRDFRFTSYENIEKWWELVYSAYLIISTQALLERASFETEDTSSSTKESVKGRYEKYVSWKKILNAWREHTLPLVCLGLLAKHINRFQMDEVGFFLTSMISRTEGFL